MLNLLNLKSSEDKKQTEPEPPTSEDGSLELVQRSRIWYRDQYKRAIMFALGVVVALIISLSLNLFQFFSKPPHKYFALTNELRVIELTPTEKANLSQEKLLNWAAETVCRTFTFDFLNYRDVLMGVRSNYTSGCFDSIYKSLESSGNLDMILSKRLVTRATLAGTPVIIKEAVIKGHRMWKIEVPIMISYESSQGIEANQSLVGSLIVSREDERKVPRGVAIHQLILKNR